MRDDKGHTTSTRQNLNCNLNHLTFNSLLSPLCNTQNEGKEMDALNVSERP